MHPLLPDVSNLSDDQLNQKISQIQRVLRSSQNGYLTQQAQQILLSLREEQSQRQAQALERALSKNQKATDVINIS